MGLFWDLMQQSQISEQRDSTANIESRVRRLEVDLRQMRDVQSRLLQLLETEFGRDIDGDGKVGG